MEDLVTDFVPGLKVLGACEVKPPLAIAMSTFSLNVDRWFIYSYIAIIRLWMGSPVKHIVYTRFKYLTISKVFQDFFCISLLLG